MVSGTSKHVMPQEFIVTGVYIGKYAFVLHRGTTVVVIVSGIRARARAKVCTDRGKAGYLSFFQKLRRPSGYFVFPRWHAETFNHAFLRGKPRTIRSVGILLDESSRMQDTRMPREFETSGNFLSLCLTREIAK